MHVFLYKSGYPKITNGQNLKIADFQKADFQSHEETKLKILGFEAGKRLHVEI